MSDKTVLITGASRGIGKSIAEIFAANGYNLVLVCKNTFEILKENSRELRGKCPTLTIREYACDVSNPDSVRSLFESLKSEGVQIDIAVNNAGISYVGLLQDMTDNDWDEVIKTNLSGAFYTSRAVLPSMIARKEGRILNISSVWGNIGASTEVAYSASKGGLNAFTKALAKEVAPSGIVVNAIACGYIDTSMNAHLSTDEKESLYEEIPSGRPGTPDEVAGFVYQIATSSKYLTGQVIKFDGGWI